MNEAFEKWESTRVGVSIEELRKIEEGAGSMGLSIRESRKAWQAAKDDDRKPQTAETCQRVPPHSMGCLRPALDLANPAMWKPGCLVCEAVAMQLRERVLMLRIKAAEKAKALAACEEGKHEPEMGI